MRQPAEYFEALNLKHNVENGWAIIERPSGAIALDPSGALFMGLTQSDAYDIANTLTTELKKKPNR